MTELIRFPLEVWGKLTNDSLTCEVKSKVINVVTLENVNSRARNPELLYLTISFIPPSNFKVCNPRISLNLVCEKYMLHAGFEPSTELL